MRLDKVLGWTCLTRSEAKRAIRAGRVTVNGITATDPDMDVAGKNVLLDGSAVTEPGHIHLMVNKPAGIITATEDPRHETVLDLVPDRLRRRGLGPIGRLDKDVTGLVILTTDGQLAHRLISPKHDVSKTYVARVEGPLFQEDVDAFASGIKLSDFTAKPANLRILSSSADFSTAEVSVTEGKFHQIKRMFAAIGHPVAALQRIRLAGVNLDKALSPGDVRLLTSDEISLLYSAAGMNQEAL